MLVLFIFTIVIFLQNHACTSSANDTLVQGERLSNNRTLVSNGNLFEFGFFTQDAINYFLGIWVKNSSDDDGVVWTANREKPVTNISFSELSFSLDGDLVLIQSQSLIWSTNNTGRKPISGIAKLLDNGNLVLRNPTNSSEIMWQSFDHPTDVWLPGAPLNYLFEGPNLFLSSGLYSLKPESCIFYSKNSINCSFIISHVASELAYKYYFAGSDFGLDIWEQDSGVLSLKYVRGTYAFIKLNNSGYVNLMQWDSTLRSFKTRSSRGSNNICDYSLLCKNKALCSVQFFTFKSCGCPSEPEQSIPTSWTPPVSGNTLLTKWYDQCSKTISVDCTNDPGFYGTDGYSLYRIYDYSDNFNIQMVQSSEDCNLACSSDCSCIAYSYNAKTCKIWNGNFLKTYRQDYSLFLEIFVRISFGSSYHKDHKGANKVTVLCVIGGLSLLSAVLILCWRCSRRLLMAEKVKVDEFLTLYSYSLIKKITKNFSEKLGEGGFGTVYKGSFSDSTPIAIKRLKGRVQEEKQFRTEVQTIGIIRHAYLVRLLGFCSEGSRRVLVYEYMSNGSLDSHLFVESSSILGWQERYKIADGIARGLTYLHEECRDCIIHCDIKPENVLLDENFRPKIADFGMAKLLGRDFSRVLTTIRGTAGYLAPEWYSGEKITQKADVYSFGMMLFEIISGKRNLSKFNNRRYPYFPLFAMIKMNEGEVVCLVDEKLGGNVNVVELMRACKVAGWCMHTRI
ncbi:Serine/threonine-protein kinase [Rhynchospora pubera]|uniref:Receptor-like serine/threonine-protein kinase n=1 Tax=Rhynchospora pubera TaxID=906938 RepID=A0AAV8FMV1_9POAL|nr:Serine/threonine-protein kinase [Rhynchospora pubera]